jgi:hypothetical protein
MELFVPSLAFLLVGVAIAYFVIPTIAPVVLIAGSIVVLIGALYMHYSRFGRIEYEQSTWQYNLQRYASYVIIGAILLGAYGFYAMNQTAESVYASPALPELSVPQMMGGGMQSVLKTVNARLGELMRRGRISVD